MRLDDRNPMSNADVLVTIEGVPGYFSECSELKTMVTRPDYSDGLTTVKRYAGSGVISHPDVTLAKAFDPEKDDSLIAFCEDMKCSINTRSLTIRPVTRCNGIERRGSKAWQLSGARVKEYGTSSFDTNDGENVTMFSLVLTVESSEWA